MNTTVRARRQGSQVRPSAGIAARVAPGAAARRVRPRRRPSRPAAAPCHRARPPPHRGRPAPPPAPPGPRPPSGTTPVHGRPGPAAAPAAARAAGAAPGDLQCRRTAPTSRDPLHPARCSALLGGGLVCLLVINTTLAAASYRINNLQQSNAQAAQRVQELQQQVATEESPGSIEQRALAARHADAAGAQLRRPADRPQIHHAGPGARGVRGTRVYPVTPGEGPGGRLNGPGAARPGGRAGRGPRGGTGPAGGGGRGAAPRAVPGVPGAAAAGAARRPVAGRPAARPSAPAGDRRRPGARPGRPDAAGQPRSAGPVDRGGAARAPGPAAPGPPRACAEPGTAAG